MNFFYSGSNILPRMKIKTNPLLVKKVPDPAGQKSPDPDAHHWFIILHVQEVFVTLYSKLLYKKGQDFLTSQY